MNSLLIIRQASLKAFLVMMAGTTLAHAATITQITSDKLGYSSFNSPYAQLDGFGWSNSLAPSAGNDYETSTTLRTPADALDHTFAGDSLTIKNKGVLSYKGTSASNIIVDNLILETGSVVTNSMAAVAFALGGNITINSGNVGALQLQDNNSGFTVSATISGEGALNITTTKTSQNTQTITLSSANNTYSGGTVIGAFSALIVESDGALGVGDVTVNGGELTLLSGNAISASAQFIVASDLPSTSSIALSFSGVGVVSGISLDGGVTYLDAGQYNAAQLNVLYGSDLFSGVGELSVVPEASSLALFSVAGALGFLFQRQIRQGE